MPSTSPSPSAREHVTGPGSAPVTPPARAWQVQEAKQRLSEVLRAAESGQPQVITRHGQDVAVVIDIAHFRRLAGVELELADFLRHGPVFDELDLERSAETMAAPDLASRSTDR